MNSTRKRSAVVYVLAALFILGLGLFIFKFVKEGDKWVVSPINEHISENGQLSYAGKIIDRNGVVLAQTIDNERVYNEDTGIRKALLQTIGDNTKFISTAIQNVFRDDLVGYSFFKGLSFNKMFGEGNDIKITLDANLCKRVLNDFDGKKGAAVVYNYVTGEILCMVSSPTFDPENPPDISNDDTGEYEGVYLNKALSSSFTPGSIFKIVTCAAAIDNIPDIFERKFYCGGSIEVDNDDISCMEHHGNINFKDAMSLSCNVVFAELAMELGKEKMTEEADLMGFNKSFEIDEIPTGKSIYNVSGANMNDLGWSGIGQYNNLANPMHMAIIMGAIANNGVPVKPYMIEKVSGLFGLTKYVGYGKEEERLLKDETSHKLKEIMRYTVETNYGNDLFSGLKACAKTGTGEVGEGKKPNGWMVGFIDESEYPLAFAVVVEDSGYGRYTAGPIVKDIIDYVVNK